MADLRALSPDERIEVLNNALQVERTRIYDGDPAHQVYARLFVTDDKGYLFILSLCESEIADTSVILNSFFMSKPTLDFNLYDVHKADAEQSLKHWKGLLDAHRGRFPVRKQIKPSEYSVERFSPNEDLAGIIKRTIEVNKKSLKSVFYSALGTLVCNAQNMESFLLMDIHESGSLKSIPLFFDNKLKGSDLYESMKMQLQSAEKYDTCTDKDLKKALGYDFGLIPTIGVQFISNNKYSFFFKNMKEDVVFSLKEVAVYDYPFNVVFSIAEDGYDFTYVYDEKVFEGFNIEEVNEQFCSVLRAGLLGEIYSGDISINKNDTNVNKARIENAKLSSLRKLSFFGDYSDREIKELVSYVDFEFRRKDQEVFPSGSPIEKIYIPVSGSIITYTKDDKGFLNPMYLIKEGEVFGIASIVKDSKDETVYMAASSDVILISMTADNFLTENVKHPELMLRMLTSEHLRLNKLSKLYSTL